MAVSANAVSAGTSWPSRAARARNVSHASAGTVSCAAAVASCDNASPAGGNADAGSSFFSARK
ncbi:MAG: hypothetical protein BWX86_00610 [Verrucomicrobia bacterium ADurb.Bin122]|nr:MAG: hypothetical protein BWX86_00610 [Verrucomicrobia bacterium ADurb.Bin122]